MDTLGLHHEESTSAPDSERIDDRVAAWRFSVLGQSPLLGLFCRKASMSGTVSLHTDIALPEDHFRSFPAGLV